MMAFARLRASAAPCWPALVLLLAGCGDGDVGPNQPPPDDLSTPNAAIRALENTYSYREAEAAYALLAPGYRFYPARPEDIPFMEPGQEAWDLAKAKEILDLLLVEERTTWIDQVLLEVSKIEERDLGEGVVEYEADTQLIVLIGESTLESSESRIVYRLGPDTDGNYRILEEREFPSSDELAKPVALLLAESIEEGGGG
ncbi:MAG TPA: hypothetical protein VKU85_01475 [bacterium]|nr:hypothetical protein [bacterium]